MYVNAVVRGPTGEKNILNLREPQPEKVTAGGPEWLRYISVINPAISVHCAPVVILQCYGALSYDQRVTVVIRYLRKH